MSNTTTNIAIFASGSGTNAENIIRYFKDHPHISVKLVLSNKADAPVLGKAEALGVPTSTFTKTDLRDSDHLPQLLKEHGIDLVILAGFLWMVPESLLQAYPDRIINIHPSLLPKYGGKGMYGSHVHSAVIAAGESESGITIHLVNAEYDKGRILYQASCPVEPGDSPESLAARIHTLEHRHFPEVIEEYINSSIRK